MPLKFFSKSKGEEPSASPHTFLCLMFVNRSVQAALWKIEGEEIVDLSQSSLLSFEDDDDGLIKIDQALQELGPESENVNQVVFGFDPHWVNGDGLIKDRKAFIKRVTEDLGLQPVGFVVITDALTQQLISEESMTSAVMVYVQEDTVFIFLMQQGKLVDQLSVGRSDDIVQDIVEGLARFAKQLTGKDSYLPPKLLLASPVLSSAELDDAQQQITAYNWSENHSFMQTPVVESMLALDVLQAVVKQGGLAVAESKGLKGKHSEAADEVAAGAADFGFEDVDSPVDEGDNFAAPADKSAVTSFGVPIDEEKITDESSQLSNKTAQKMTNRSNKRKFKMPAIFGKIAAWYRHHPHKNAIRGGIIGGMVALLLLIIGWAAFAYQVVISVQLAEKVIAKDLEIVVDPNIASTNVERQILKGSLETLEVTDETTIETTGVTLVGDAAKGTVTIFNKTTAPKTFTAGTSLSTGSVAFTLDDEVTVASASSEESGGQAVTTFGQEEAAVTATGIGAEGNIGGGTKLTIANFATSTYEATAKETFSGGSSREVRVVDEEDLTDILQTLTDSLLDEAAKQFADKSGNGTYYVLTSSYDVVEENYSAEAGDETNQLGLALTLETSAVKYNSADIRPLLEEALKDEIPEGYALIEDEPELLTSPRDDATGSSTRVVLDANVKTKARPPIDQANVIDSILGLSLDEMVMRLADRPEIERASYVLRPGIAKWFTSKVPNNLDRVTLEISNEAN